MERQWIVVTIVFLLVSAMSLFDGIWAIVVTHEGTRAFFGIGFGIAGLIFAAGAWRRARPLSDRAFKG